MVYIAALLKNYFSSIDDVDILKTSVYLFPPNIYLTTLSEKEKIYINMKTNRFGVEKTAKKIFLMVP